MSDLAALMAELKGRWMIGGTALEKAPVGWRDVLNDDPNPELALLAIAGQMSQVALRASPGGDLRPLPVLPRLSLPPINDICRPMFQRLLQSRSGQRDEMPQILRLMVARGWSVHPADYMPRSFAKLPSVYSPWEDWTQSRPDHSEKQLTTENWDLWFPAARREQLNVMRASDSSEALALIVENAAGLPAEHRLQVVDTIAIGLNPDDVPYLESLANDRSGKVRDLAAQFLARLGQTGANTEDVQEYADFFVLSKAGLLRRVRKLQAKPLKTNAQRARRGALSQKVGLQDFAAELTLTPSELVTAWDGGAEATSELIGMVSATGSDDIVRQLVARMGDAPEFSTDRLAPLAERLTSQDRAASLSKSLSLEDSFFYASTWAFDALGTVSAEKLQASPAMELLLRQIAESQTQDRHRGEQSVIDELFALGLLADRIAAETLIETFKSAGLYGSDPALNLLALNAALEPRSI